MWQPIETAPKDRPLLVWHPGLGMGGWNVMRLERKACAKICRNLADTWARKDDEQDALERAAIEIEKL